MKKIALIVALLGVVALVGQAWAGGACCASKKSKDGSASAEHSCSSALSGLNLTADQQAKIDKIEESCKVGGSSKEACAKAKNEIRDVLTAEQRVEFDAACSKSAHKGCGG